MLTFLTKDGTGGLVVMDNETYDRRVDKWAYSEKQYLFIFQIQEDSVFVDYVTGLRLAALLGRMIMMVCCMVSICGTGILGRPSWKGKG